MIKDYNRYFMLSANVTFGKGFGGIPTASRKLKPDAAYYSMLCDWIPIFSASGKLIKLTYTRLESSR